MREREREGLTIIRDETFSSLIYPKFVSINWPRVELDLEERKRKTFIRIPK